MVNQYGCINSCAVTPDQLTHYVEAISGMKPLMLNGFPFYASEGQGVLAAFSKQANSENEIHKAVDLALATPGLEKLTVLSDHKPVQAPDHARIHTDNYWLLDLPAKPGQKTRNMLTASSKILQIIHETGKKAITASHMQLQGEFCQRKGKNLDDASQYIFGKMPEYAESSENTHIFSAWNKDRLAGFAVADFTSFHYVFYMFAFRSQNAPPGTADLLLHSIIEEACKLGYQQINLGLGINAGIEFFKKKWGAFKGFPYVETEWQMPEKPGIFSRLAKFFKK